jgi:hypothetical protein
MRLRRRRWDVQDVGREITFDELLAVAQGGAEDVAKTMRPDEDWQPTLLVSGSRGSTSFALDVRREPGELMHREIPDAVASVDGTRWAFFCSSWMRWFEADEPKEVVVLLAREGEREDAFHAPILRAPNSPPELGEWKAVTAEIRT